MFFFLSQGAHLLQPVRPAALQLPGDAPREAPPRRRGDTHIWHRVVAPSLNNNKTTSLIRSMDYLIILGHLLWYLGINRFNQPYVPISHKISWISSLSKSHIKACRTPKSKDPQSVETF